MTFSNTSKTLLFVTRKEIMYPSSSKAERSLISSYLIKTTSFIGKC